MYVYCMCIKGGGWGVGKKHTHTSVAFCKTLHHANNFPSVPWEGMLSDELFTIWKI